MIRACCEEATDSAREEIERKDALGLGSGLETGFGFRGTGACTSKSFWGTFGAWIAGKVLNVSSIFGKVCVFGKVSGLATSCIECNWLKKLSSEVCFLLMVVSKFSSTDGFLFATEI